MGVVEERVVIHVDIDTDLAKASKDIEALFKMIETRGKLAEKNLDKVDKKLVDIDKTTTRVSKSNGKLAKSNNRVTQSFDKLKKTLKSVGGVLGNFLSKFGLFSFIGVAIEIGLISIALLGVKLALVSGRLAVKAYQSTLVGLGVAAGGVAVVEEGAHSDRRGSRNVGGLSRGLRNGACGSA